MARRDDVIEAAIACLEAGEGAGINAVARRLGIRPPSLYKHVPSGEELGRAVAVEGWRRLVDSLSLPEAAPSVRLKALMVGYRDFALGHPSLYAHMSETSLGLDRPEALRLSQDLLAPFDTALADMKVAPRDRIHELRALRAAIHGFVGLEIAGQFQLGEDVDTSFERMCRRLIQSFRR